MGASLWPHYIVTNAIVFFFPYATAALTTSGRVSPAPIFRIRLMEVFLGG
jgi:hypothetical protein